MVEENPTIPELIGCKRFKQIKDLNIVNTIKIIPILGVIYTFTDSHEALLWTLNLWQDGEDRYSKASPEQ